MGVAKQAGGGVSAGQLLLFWTMGKGEANLVPGFAARGYKSDRPCGPRWERLMMPFSVMMADT